MAVGRLSHILFWSKFPSAPLVHLKSRRLFPAGTILLLYSIALLLAFSSPATAAPDGYKGWCTVTAPGTSVCVGDPMTACQIQHDYYSPTSIFYGYEDGPFWTGKHCSWSRVFANPLPATVHFECEYGYKRLPPGICVKEDENAENRGPDAPSCGMASVNNGGNGAPATGHPIDLTTGSKLFRVTDFVTGDGSLSLERIYSSMSYGNQKGIMSRAPWGIGQGWRFGFQFELHLGNYSQIELATPEGSALAFSGTPSGTFSPAQQGYSLPRQTDYTLQFVGTYPSSWTDVLAASTQWKVKDSKDRVWTFQTYQEVGSGKYTAALPIAVTFRNGLQWTLAYGTYHELTSITDSYGKSISFTWYMNDPTALGSTDAPSPVGIKSATLPDGTTLQYVADSIGSSIAIDDRLIAVEHRDASNTLLDSTTYLHENADFPYHVTGIKDASGIRRWTVAYDSRGRAITSTGPNDADKVTVSYGTPSGGTLTRTVTNALGKQSVYNFNWSSGNVSLAQVDGTASTNCPASTDQTYGLAPTTRFINSSTDAEGRVRNYTRNDRGLPTQIIDGYGTASARTTTITWHSEWNVPTQIVEPNLTTDYTWTSGQLTQVTQTDTTSQTVPYSTNGQTRTWNFTYDSYGSLLTADGPLAGTGDTVTYTYNTSGYLSSVTNEVGHVTTISAVDGRGLPITVVDPNGVVSNLTYDSERRLKTVTVDPSGVSAVTAIDYNAVGDITKVTRPNGAYLQYTYDDGRRVTRIEDNSGASIEFDRDYLGNVTARRIKDAGGTGKLSQTATYDELGRLLKFIGAANQTWTHAYDKTSNLVSVTDPRSNVFGWSFDALNRLISTADEDSNTVTLTRNGKDEITNYEDPRSLNTSFVRDGFGDVIQRTSPDSGTTVYTYNEVGKPTQITDGRGIVTNLTYDDAGRLLTRQYPAATGENLTYTWDATTGGNKGIGRVTRIDDGAGSIEWTYNVLGQVTEEKKTTGSVVYTVGYAYDLDGNVTQVTYPSGRTVSYSRGATGLVTAVTTKKDSGSASVTLASGVAYQPFGPLQALTYGNGLILWKTFTQDYTLNTIVVEQGSNSIINRGYGYWYDDFNISNVWDNNDTGRTENYIYTPSQRLQNAYGDWGELTYYQDGVGNRVYQGFDDGVSPTEKTLLYPYDSNRIGGEEQGSTQVRTITHDDAGNIVTDDRNGTIYHYRYNNRNRLDQLTVGTTVTASYGYDGLERMAVRTTQSPAATTHYVYDRAGRMIAEATGTGAIQREYVWLDDMLLATVADVDTASPKLWYVHPDQIDRPSRMTDGSQAVVWDAWYWPYGEARAITGTATLNMRAPGQYFLAESGTMSNWHRQYDPTLGRYLQPDPIADVLATRPVNLDGSTLVARGGISGGSQLASPTAAAASTRHRSGVGNELPTFIDGPSVYQFARSMPAMYVDINGLNIGGASLAGVSRCVSITTPIARRTPRLRCVMCDAPTAGTYYPYCPDCYKKSTDPKGGVPPIPIIIDPKKLMD